MRGRGKKLFLLSGDNHETVSYIANALEFKSAEYHSSFSPNQKRDFIVELKNAETVAMVGDGVNDAEALMESNLSIAIAGGIVECLKVADMSLFQKSQSRA